MKQIQYEIMMIKDTAIYYPHKYVCHERQFFAPSNDVDDIAVVDVTYDAHDAVDKSAC